MGGSSSKATVDEKWAKKEAEAREEATKKGLQYGWEDRNYGGIYKQKNNSASHSPRKDRRGSLPICRLLIPLAPRSKHHVRRLFCVENSVNYSGLGFWGGGGPP